MAFSENLRKARKRMNMTQQQVADKLGITKSAYCGYETGKREPCIARLCCITTILNTSPDNLLGFTNSRSIDDCLKAVLWGNNPELSEEDKDILLADVKEYFNDHLLLKNIGRISKETLPVR